MRGGPADRALDLDLGPVRGLEDDSHRRARPGQTIGAEEETFLGDVLDMTLADQSVALKAGGNALDDAFEAASSLSSLSPLSL